MTPNAAFLAGQIRIVNLAIKRDFDFDPATNTKVIEGLAARLDGYGLTDCRHLAFYSDPGSQIEFFYDLSTGKDFGNLDLTQAQIDAMPKFAGVQSIFQMQVGSVEHYVSVYFTPDGYPVFICVRIDQGPLWPSIFRGILPLVAVGLSVCFPALGATLGNAISGPTFAAAYPAVATGIGNVCIGTALDGGDVKSAIISTLSAGLGQGVGGLVASISDSTIIGNVAAAVTKAAVTGGDITQAGAYALVSSGVNSIAALPSIQPQATQMQLGEFDDDLSLNAPANNGGSTSDVAIAVPGSSYSYYDPNTTPVTSGLYSDYGGGDTGAGGAGTAYQTTPNAPTTYGSDAPGAVLTAATNVPPAGPSGVVASAGGLNLGALAVAALQTVNAWHNAGQPSIRTSSATAQANANGTVTQLNANGTTSVVQMPVGTPYLTAAGLVTNNGNGTYTTISNTGQASVQAYPTSSGLLSSSITIGGMQIPTVALIGGAALVLLLAMKR